MSQETDVTIVGAGPCGLVIAAILAKYGVKYRLLEKDVKRSPHSKALGVHSRTLELLDLLDSQVVKRMIRTGSVVPFVNFWNNRQILDLRNSLDNDYPFLLIIPQETTEQFLEEVLHQHNGKIERGCEVAKIVSDNEKYTITVQTSSGEKTIKSHYVIGTDGAHSIVRKRAGLEFPGKGYNFTALMADTALSPPVTSATTYNSLNAFAMFIPIKEDLTRVVVIDKSFEELAPGHKVTTSDIQNALDRFTRSAPTLGDSPKWVTSWSSQLRQVPCYRSGNMFLAGDAAHIHSPAGGQGLNTAIQDGFNLAWKLGVVMSGKAPHSLLETYNTERHPVGKRVLRSSDLILRVMMVSSWIGWILRWIFILTLVRIPYVKKQIALNVSGVGISYRTRWDSFKSLRKRCKLVAGDRIPNCAIIPANVNDSMDTDMSIYKVQRDVNGFTMFLYEELATVQSRLPKIRELVKWAVSTRALTVCIVYDNGVIPKTDLNVQEFVDHKAHFGNRLKLDHRMAVMIRPDCYIAEVFGESYLQNLQVLQAALSKWIVT